MINEPFTIREPREAHTCTVFVEGARCEYSEPAEGERVPFGHTTVRYQWFHIPTSRGGFVTIAMPRPELLPALLAFWNRQQPGVWEYFAVS